MLDFEQEQWRAKTERWGGLRGAKYEFDPTIEAVEGLAK